MGVYRNVTNLFTNNEKRYAEEVVVTCPALLNTPQRGGDNTYIQSGDAWTAAVIEGDSIVKKAYLIVDEAFPSGTTLTIDVAGQSFFIDVPGDATGLTVSTLEDAYFKNGQTVTIGITSGTAGTDVTSGEARVVFEVGHPSLKNGTFAVS